MLTWDASEAMAKGIEPPYSVVPGVSDVATLTTLQPRQSTVQATIVADWHATERRRREVGRDGRE